MFPANRIERAFIRKGLDLLGHSRFTDNLLKKFNAALYDDMKQAMEEADKTMIEKCKELAHRNMKPLTDLDERVLMEGK